jgi:hypothetical protein
MFPGGFGIGGLSLVVRLFETHGEVVVLILMRYKVSFKRLIVMYRQVPMSWMTISRYRTSTFWVFPIDHEKRQQLKGSREATTTKQSAVVLQAVKAPGGCGCTLFSILLKILDKIKFIFKFDIILLLISRNMV